MIFYLKKQSIAFSFYSLPAITSFLLFYDEFFCDFARTGGRLNEV